MSSSMRCRSGLTDCWMDGADIGSSSRAEGDPSCSEPDPDPLNLSSAHCWRCPLRRPRHPPAERVRTWAQSGRRFCAGIIPAFHPERPHNLGTKRVATRESPEVGRYSLEDVALAVRVGVPGSAAVGFETGP